MQLKPFKAQQRLHSFSPLSLHLSHSLFSLFLASYSYSLAPAPMAMRVFNLH